jgi:serpin B
MSPETNPEAKEVAESLNAFGIDLYRNLTAGEESTFFSPFSVALALAMLYIGARGPTAEEIGQVLHLHWSGEPLSQGIASILAVVNDSAQLGGAHSGWSPNSQRMDEFNVANALWIQQNFPVEPQYRDWIQTYFGGTLFEVDFQAAEQVCAQVNAWVFEQTRGKISGALPPQFFDSIRNPVTAVIVNAIYFFRQWQFSFSREATRPQPFYLLGGGKISLPLMQAAGYFRFVENDEVQYIELPYQGEALVMGILLPTWQAGLPWREEELTVEMLNHLAASCRKEKLDVFLPRFKVDSMFNLLPVFQQMGIVTALDPGIADFSGMLSDSGGVNLSGAIHRACVEVDEEGTEAAAVTMIATSRLVEIKQTPTFRADHPFLFLIRHVKTGQILFLGRWTGILRGD